MRDDLHAALTELRRAGAELRAEMRRERVLVERWIAVLLLVNGVAIVAANVALIRLL